MEDQGGLKERAATAHNVIVGKTIVMSGDNEDDDMSEITHSQAVRGTMSKETAATHGGGGHATKSTTVGSRLISDEKLREIARGSGKRRRPVGKPPVHRPRSRPGEAREDDCNEPSRDRRGRRRTRSRCEERAGPAQEEAATFRELSRELKKEGWTTKA